MIRTLDLLVLMILLSGAASASYAGKEENSVVPVETSNPNAKGPNHWPIIFDAIEAEDTTRVKALLDRGADIESQGFQNATPVLAAAKTSDWPMALMLLDRGARADVADKLGFTLAFLAATSRVDLQGRYGKALKAVRQRLKARGLLPDYRTPRQVRAGRKEQ